MKRLAPFVLLVSLAFAAFAPLAMRSGIGGACTYSSRPIHSNTPNVTASRAASPAQSLAVVFMATSRDCNWRQ